MDETSSSYWLSHNTHNGPGVSGPPRPGDLQYRIRMLSVVLDGEARFRFGAIRVLVLSKLPMVTITECADPTRDVGFPQNDDPGYRCRLSRRLVSRSESRKTMVEAETQSLQTCTILLELVAAGTDTNCEWWYRPGVQLVPRPDISNPFSEFTVVYDHFQKCTPAKPSVVLFLESNRSFRPLQGSTYLYNLGHPGISALSIRVVPIDARKRPRIHLPPKIVTRIAELCIGLRAPPWRSELLSYGLVCKAWLHVLDLFFQTFVLSPGGNYNRDPPHLHRVARCLDARPDRGALIHNFSDDDYAKEPHRFGADDWRELTGILRRLDVTRLRGVILGCVPACVADELAGRLARLRNVRWLELGEQRDEDGFDFGVYRTIYDAPSLPSRIEELQLSCGFLTASQLSRFTLSCNPCLRLCRLSRIKGLSNSGFASFLSLVASSLITLEISHCEFPLLSGDADDEELAIDSLMPRLTSLRRLVVNGPGIVTSLSISRKSSMTTVHQRCAVVVSDVTREMKLEETSKALEVTGWSSVCIHWRRMDQTDVGPYVQTALETATRRGIELCYSVGRLGISFGSNVGV
ncbi:hypothetical protein C0995_010399 [Termitomyces sp. Mi166|nr:hypothetical protein C0995_010399 [Termitomyces sp. Mi166\